MKLELRFFASLREALGVSQESIVVPEMVNTISELRMFLAQRGAPWSEVLAEGKALRCALNHVMVAADTHLEAGAEIAFFPPVTGG